jgi:hypothetical protein
LLLYVRVEVGGQCCGVWWLGREATRSGTRCSAGGAKVVARVDGGKAVRGNIIVLAVKWRWLRLERNIFGLKYHSVPISI